MKGALVALFAAIALLDAFPSASASTENVRRFYKNLDTENLVLTKLEYYIHAVFPGGANQTVFQVASADISRTSGSNFGGILVIDNKLTVGPDPNSQYVGQYQGINAYSDFHVAALNMNMNIVFRGGKYDRSTLTIMGRQPVTEEDRIMSVVGGTGEFHLAKGTVIASTVSVDPVKLSGVYFYEMYVVTPKVKRSRTVVPASWFV